MATNSKQRVTLTDLSQPLQMRELNRQLAWVWDQILGGLPIKALNADAQGVINSKAESSVTDALDGRVRTSETFIMQNAIEISTKASQDTVDNLGNRVSSAETSIMQNATEISTKASASDVNSLTGRVTNAETSIRQNANSITLKADKSYVDGIQIGGTNLIDNSKSLTVVGSHNYSQKEIYKGLIPNQKYTFSVDSAVLTAGSTDKYTLAIFKSDWSTDYAKYELPISNSRQTLTFIAPNASDTHLLLYPGLWSQAAGKTTVFTKLKLEIGDKATDWCPSAGELYGTSVEVTAENGLRVLQTLAGQALESYFQANATKFGLYMSATGKAFAEGGVSNGKGYFAVNMLKDPQVNNNCRIELSSATNIEGYAESFGLGFWWSNTRYGGIFIPSATEETAHGMFLHGSSFLSLVCSLGAYIRLRDDIRVNGSIAPDTTNTYKLGYSNNRWQTVCLKNSPDVSSDRRLKRSIRGIVNAFEFIMALNPVRYELISDGDTAHPHYGFVAQDVSTAISQSGTEKFDGYIDDDPDHLSLRYEEFIAPMVATIQTQQMQIDDLKVRLDALEQRVGQEVVNGTESSDI